MTVPKYFWRVVRISLLLICLSGAFFLYQWSKQRDPRFYLFLNTGLGQSLARVFHWRSSAVEALSQDKTPEQMTPEERRLFGSMQETVRQGASGHRIVLKDGRVLSGDVEKPSPDVVVVRQPLGNLGSVTTRIPAANVQAVEALPDPGLFLRYRDVRFKMEYPSFSHYLRPPYSIMTDESFLRVDATVRDLQSLHRQFLGMFNPLVRDDLKNKNLQVLFFADEAAFSRYQKKNVPQMDNSSGFYSPQIDRLVFYNQATSAQFREMRADADMPGGGRRTEAWKQKARQDADAMAEEMTRAAIRHEGAHQLFFTLGVHSTFQVENTWVVEGLAAYCEPEPVGGISQTRCETLAGSMSALIPLDELLATRSEDGLMVFGNQDRVELAYAECWSLVHFLMEPANRPGFFAYLRFIRDPQHLRATMRTPTRELLAKALGIKPEEVEKRWREHLQSLVHSPGTQS